MSVEDIEKPENMATFFDVRAAGYDDYIQGFIFSETTYSQFYQSVSLPIEKTNAPFNILDLGCGTGLEIEFLLQRVPFSTHTYDHIISAMSIHHLLRETKLDLYKKIHSVLKPGGKYVEGDSVTTADAEREFLAEFYESLENMPENEDGYYHINFPFSIDT